MIQNYIKIIIVLSLTLVPFASNSIANQEKVRIIPEKCEWNGIQLYGKVKFVTSFPDIKIQFVNSFEDIRVKYVTSFPDQCGEWQVVESFPDFRIQVVESFPDIKVRVVESFPGMH